MTGIGTLLILCLSSRTVESAEAESGIAQTTVGMYIFHSEDAGVGPVDQPTDVGVEVLQCHSWVCDAFWTDLCA